MKLNQLNKIGKKQIKNKMKKIIKSYLNKRIIKVKENTRIQVNKQAK